MVNRLAEDKEQKQEKTEKQEKQEKQKISARKVKDKWRAKEWYKVFAPDMFGGQQIAETLSADPSLLQGRIISVALQDITGDFSKMHIKLNLKISRVAGFDAHTDFVGHDLTSDYIRRLTRRKHSKMDGVFSAHTKDGYTIKIKPMAITEKRIQTSQQKAIRHLMNNIVSTTAGKQTLGEVIKDVLSGDMAKMIFKECKPVYPIRKIEIRRTEITEFPSPSELAAAAAVAAATAEAASAAFGVQEPVQGGPAAGPTTPSGEGTAAPVEPVAAPPVAPEAPLKPKPAMDGGDEGDAEEE
jgi:small subunit ribosomal protein S3Ae